jgi:hypothetical protein
LASFGNLNAFKSNAQYSSAFSLVKNFLNTFRNILKAMVFDRRRELDTGGGGL